MGKNGHTDTRSLEIIDETKVEPQVTTPVAKPIVKAKKVTGYKITKVNGKVVKSEPIYS